MASSVREALDQPLALVQSIMDLRGYARTKAAVDAAKTPNDMPSGGYVDTVLEIQAEIAREIMAERKRKRGKS